jgi:hypothetical protein
VRTLWAGRSGSLPSNASCPMSPRLPWKP